MSVTLSTLRTLTYWVMREEENCSAYPYTLVDMFLDSTQLDYCSGQLTDPLTWDTIRKWDLPFLNVDKFYSNVQSTSLSVATTVWATTLTVASTDSYTTTSGEMVLYIGWDIITYTGKTSTTFTGVSWVAFARPAGTNVSPVFVLPTDYMSPKEVRYNNAFPLKGKKYDEVFKDLYDYKWSGMQTADAGWVAPFTPWFNTAPFYTIKDNQYLIVWNLDATGPAIHLRYEKKPTEFTTTSTTATIDNDTYAKIILSTFAAAELLMFRWEEMRAKQIINDVVRRKVKASYVFYNNTDYEEISWSRPEMDKWGRGFNI